MSNQFPYFLPDHRNQAPRCTFNHAIPSFMSNQQGSLCSRRYSCCPIITSMQASCLITLHPRVSCLITGSTLLRFIAARFA